MTRKERETLKTLKSLYNASERYNARDEAWDDIMRLAEERGYGSRPCSMESALDYLMGSTLETQRMVLKMYGRYCAASANVDAANHVGLALAEIEL